jgi:7,8-dihydropterin-6-yl-methyl-4-(beta-D-ribofuranosyl)aminobenzene 5'-phosphate synthase
MNVATGETRITILVDNTAREGLESEHGFSAWIEAAGRRLIFDTGQGPALPGNAGRLGVDLRLADAMVFSHGHFDHTGGVRHVVGSAPAVQVYCHPAAFSLRYAVRDGSARSIGMPDAARLALERQPPASVHRITEPCEIAAGVGLTGLIPRLSDLEDTGGPFFIDAEGKHGDPITDDLALWMRTDLGLVVVVGCSHAGVINTLQYAQRLSGESRVHAVMGGFHLREAAPARLAWTADALRDAGVEVIVPCHCTGDRAVEWLRNVLGERVRPGSAGSIYRFGAAKERA